ncbi:peroxisome biogenesis protein 1, partial [Asbolus verrucosus]
SITCNDCNNTTVFCFKNSVALVYNENETVCVSVNPASNFTDDQSIGFNSLYAKALGIEDNSLVTLTEIAKPPTIQSVIIAAINESDHHVLVMVIVTPMITIDHLTEVVIKPPGEEFKQIINNKNEKETAMKDIKENYDKDIATFDLFADYKDRVNNLILRLVPFKELDKKIGELCHPFSVFVSKNSFLKKLPDTVTNPQIYSAKLLSADNSEDKVVYVRLFVFEDFLNDFKLNAICSENVFVSEVLMDFYDCDIGARVLLEPCKDIPPEQYLADNCKSQKFILNPNIVLNVGNNLRCFLRFEPCQAKFCIVNPDFVRSCTLLVVNESLPPKEVLEKNEFSLSKYTTEVANYQEIVDKSLFLFVYNTKVYSKMYNVLITGKGGTGKTTLLKTIQNIITSFPYFIYTKKINCKSVKGKTVESLHKLFVTAFFDLVHHQPSVLILDDLHILCENVNETDALAQNSVYFNRVSEMLEGVFQSFCEHNAIGILASASSTSKLNKNIYATRGNHLFKNVYSINQLSKSDRKKLLEFFFSDYELENVNLEKLAQKTESFVMQDMNDLADKTLFESYQEDHNQNVIKITREHCEKALETVTLTSLEGVNLHPLGDRDLDDIGGLADVKKILIETMLWPAKYPNLFTNAPLRLPSGLLLYGPPGTGKTILAEAAARHCGLRLISIKGPELLSKYIGASEQAVRDVFQRAQSARPCLLFFDEFDSLAPRRGHDNTGVTDRVVNQLLTQLDGIESLSGVFVLAATSRPDLLDPALLRPGRLDRHIRCSLPDEVLTTAFVSTAILSVSQPSRLDILKALSKSLKFSPDVNLSELARASYGFSGADLQAVLYSAQLDSVKDLLEDEENMEEFQSEIRQAQLMEALKNTRPSLTKAEQAKYDRIYQNFEGGASPDFTPGSRATLA